MDIEVRPCSSVEELRDALNAISHYFGHENHARGRRAVRASGSRSSACTRPFDGDRSSAARARSRSACRCPAGTRRRPRASPSSACCRRTAGAVCCESVMHAQLDDVARRGDVAACLWASEATIYGRFGYGLASRIGAITLARDRTRFAQPFEPRGTVRLVDLEEAARTFPPLYEQVVAQRPGMISRTQDVVGDATALRRSRAPAGRAEEPRAARARRRARRLCDLQREAGLGRGLEQGRGQHRRGRDADAGGGARALALAARLRLDVGVRRRPTAARPCAVPARSPSRGACSSRSTTACGCD